MFVKPFQEKRIEMGIETSKALKFNTQGKR